MMLFPMVSFPEAQKQAVNECDAEDWACFESGRNGYGATLTNASHCGKLTDACIYTH